MLIKKRVRPEGHENEKSWKGEGLPDSHLAAAVSRRRQSRRPAVQPSECFPSDWPDKPRHRAWSVRHETGCGGHGPALPSGERDSLLRLLQERHRAEPSRQRRVRTNSSFHFFKNMSHQHDRLFAVPSSRSDCATDGTAVLGDEHRRRQASHQKRP